MKIAIHTAKVVTLMLGAALLMLGCRRVEEPVTGGNGDIELQLSGAISSVAQVGQSKAAALNMPVGTEVRVVAYEAGTYNTGTPNRLYQGVYIVVTADGTMYPKTPADRMMVDKGAYDFRLYSPAYEVADPINVANGQCFLSCVVLNKTIDVDHRLLSATFDRLSARIDFVIKAKPKAFVQSMEINSAGDRPAMVRNLPVHGVVAQANGYVAASDDRTGTVAFDAKRFVHSGSGISSVLSTEADALGVLIIGATDYPGSSAAPVKLKIEVPLLVNGLPMYMTMELKTGLATKPGYRYIVEVLIDQTGDPEYSVKVEPWVEGESSDNSTIRGRYKVGEYIGGGEVVFWVDPLDAEEHYKTIFMHQQAAKTYDKAKADAAVTMGAQWRLPLVDEFDEVAANWAAVSTAFTTLNVPIITSQQHWSGSEVDASQAYVSTFDAGIEQLANKTATYPFYYIKEYSLTLDYTKTPANCYVSYLKGVKYLPVMFNALKKPIAKYAAGNATPVNVKGANPSTADVGLENDIVYQAGDVIEVSWQTAVSHGTTAGLDHMVINKQTYNDRGTAYQIKLNSADEAAAVKVEVNGPGNALLSYKRNGVILWNYHIWVTGSNPFANHCATGSNVNGNAAGGTQAGFMDRNMGALAATTTQPASADAYKYFGVYYQYGNLTPLTGQGAGTTVGAYTTIFDKSGIEISAGSIGGYTMSERMVPSITTVIQNPNTFYSGEGTLASNWTWYDTDISLWSEYSINKSIYDPCPYGYRVPKDGSWKGFPGNDIGSVKIENGTAWSNTWWPMAGTRESSGRSIGAMSTVGDNGFYWTSSLFVDDPYMSYASFFTQSGNAYASSLSEHGAGLSVRCVQEGY